MAAVIIAAEDDDSKHAGLSHLAEGDLCSPALHSQLDAELLASVSVPVFRQGGQEFFVDLSDSVRWHFDLLVLR
ncbi:hypothetical protein [Bradyrhizobium sp. AZCC 1721]|uniref:hypothetical protein n=1 Tax=Bradyrhizobium sp. AZCC 1721 TaxID=3117016 RepID=UPI002FF41418